MALAAALYDASLLRSNLLHGPECCGHEIERQGRWKQGGGMFGRYTRGESAGSALRYL